MGTREYDHHNKAGNRGDVVKHVALIAALQGTLDEFDGPMFRYADAYAGYAWNPLSLSQGWREGIGKATPTIEARLSGDEPIDRHIRWWFDRYLGRQGGPDFRDAYPGSATIASDVLTEWAAPRRQTGHSLAAWDTSKPVVDDLERNLPGDSRQVFHRPATLSESAIREASFLFIDPPYMADWPVILPFLKDRPEAQSVLAWLPLCPSDGRFAAGAAPACPPEQLAMEARCDGMSVRWPGGGGLSGCLLLYSLGQGPTRRLREAVGNLSQLMGWRTTDFAAIPPKSS